MHPQIPLPLKLLDDYSFDNFITDSDSLILQSLQHSNGDFIFLWGDSGTGKTHLLQAACQQATVNNRTTSYLPLKDILEYPSSILDGMETVDLICIDDIHLVHGKTEWEEALFNLFNNLKQNNRQLIISSNAAPHQLSIKLKDLKSRLSSCLPLNILPLSNEATIEAMQHRAKNIGLELPRDVAEFILNRFSRDLSSLWQMIERLNQASLAAKRKLTIPFVKLTLLN